MSTDSPDGPNRRVESVATGSVSEHQEQPTAAVFSYGFYPQFDFEVINQLEPSTTVELLLFDGDTVRTLTRPDEWRGHVIQYASGEASGRTTFLFVHERWLSPGTTGSLARDASVYSPQLNLLEADLELDDGAAEDDEEAAEDGEDGETEDEPEETENGDEPTGGNETAEETQGDDANETEADANETEADANETEVDANETEADGNDTDDENGIQIDIEANGDDDEE